MSATSEAPSMSSDVEQRIATLENAVTKISEDLERVQLHIGVLQTAGEKGSYVKYTLAYPANNI